MIDFKKQLNPEQLAAVTGQDGPRLVVAGAGSGKTRVLTYRLAWLVHQGVMPRHILLMTFTNRAAREMLGRVEELLGADTGGVTGGTFHHVGNLFLRRFAGRLERDPEYTIIDREDSKQLMRRCLPGGKQARDSKKRLPSHGVLMAIAGFIKNTLQPLSEVLAQDYPMFSDKEEEIDQILGCYEQFKREMKLMDFDDLLSDFHCLLREHEDVRDFLSDRFRYILVDEFQDTNRVQGEIVDLLAGKTRNVCVVGDDAQSIYSFRGASFANILHFTDRYPDAQVYRLEQNYRSRPPILAAANAGIAFNRRRLPKRLVAVRENGEPPVVVLCRDGNQQARILACHLEEFISRGVAPGAIAVLYRSHYHSMEIQLQLQRQGIPFQVRGGLRFFEQAHVKDLISFLRAACNPRDHTAWMRFLLMLPGVGERTAGRICNCLAESSQSLAGTLSRPVRELVPAKARERFDEMSKNILRAAENLYRPGHALETVNREFYDALMISIYSSPRRRREDLRAVINFAGQYDNAADFLSEIALTSEYSGLPHQPGGSSQTEEDMVVLSTIHQAKGLEWSVVLLPWLAEGRFPASQSMELNETLEEERRIFHVALTRAEDWLVIYAPQEQQRKDGFFQPLKLSRFVDEIPENLRRTLLAPVGSETDCSLFTPESAGSSQHHQNSSGRRRSGMEWSDDGLPVVYLD